jgi:hypothetical protein
MVWPSEHVASEPIHITAKAAPGRAAAGRGRPPQAAARRAGLEFVEKLLTKLTSTDTTERNAMLGIPPRSIGRAG